MSNRNDNEQIIKKITELTCSEKIKWSRIPDYLEKNKNESLRKYLISANKYFYMRAKEYNWPMLQEYESYCTEINDGLVILFSYIQKDESQYFEIAFQALAGRLVEKLNGNMQNQKILEVLWKSVKTGGRDADSFLDSLLQIE